MREDARARTAKYVKGLSLEKREEYKNKKREYWQKLTPEQRANQKYWYGSLSQEERQQFLARIRRKRGIKNEQRKIMTPITLTAQRMLLFFTRAEAAAMIGGVSVQSWHYWEDGKRPIPADVIETMGALCEYRATALTATVRRIDEMIEEYGDGHQIDLLWYKSIDDWMTLPEREPILWRPHCSIAAEIAASHSAAVLVPFNSVAYAEWLGVREDNEQARSMWAAQQSA